METKLKELTVVDGMVEAEIIRAKLMSFDIPCLLKFESAGRLFGITMDGLGKVKVLVNENQFEEARQILNTSETISGEESD